MPADAYYAVPVYWAAENGITSGTDAAHFSPDACCTRAETVTFLWRLAGEPAPASREIPFEDVPEGAYYADAVLWACENGIVKGTDAAHFSPDAAVTRAQCVALLCRTAGGEAEADGEAADGSGPFLDVPEDAWYRDAILWAVSHGVTRGKTDTLFAPDACCTRAEIVTFLDRAAVGEGAPRLRTADPGGHKKRHSLRQPVGHGRYAKDPGFRSRTFCFRVSPPLHGQLRKPQTCGSAESDFSRSSSVGM